MAPSLVTSPHPEKKDTKLLDRAIKRVDVIACFDNRFVEADMFAAVRGFLFDKGRYVALQLPVGSIAPRVQCFDHERFAAREHY